MKLADLVPGTEYAAVSEKHPDRVRFIEAVKAAKQVYAGRSGGFFPGTERMYAKVEHLDTHGNVMKYRGREAELVAPGKIFALWADVAEKKDAEQTQKALIKTLCKEIEGHLERRLGGESVAVHRAYSYRGGKEIDAIDIRMDLETARKFEEWLLWVNA